MKWFLLGMGLGLASGYTIAVLVISWKMKRDMNRFIAKLDDQYGEDPHFV